MNIKKMAGLLMLAVICIPCQIAKAQSGSFDWREVVRNSKPSIVTIYCYDASGNQYGEGTGFFVDSADIVTCQHVLEHAFRAECRDENKNVQEITGIVASDRDADLVKARVAILFKRKGLPIAKSLPEEGEPIAAIGSPRGLELGFSAGNVSAVRTVHSRDDQEMTEIQISVPVSEGSSGSPLFNLKGEVVGVAKSIERNAENLNFATPALYIKSMHDQSPTPLKVWSKGMAEYPEEQVMSGEPSSHGEQTSNAPWWSSLPPRDDPKFVEDSLQAEGIDRFRRGDFQDALDKFQHSMSYDSSNGSIWYMIGESYFQLNEYSHAASAFEQSASRCLGKVNINMTLDLLFGLANSYFAINQRDSALNYYSQALILDPANPVALNGAGRCYLMMGKDTLAWQSLKKAVDEETEIPDSYFFLGMIYMHWERNRDAESAVRKAISIKREPMYFAGLGDIYWDSGFKNEAIENYRISLQLYTDRHRRSDFDEIDMFVQNLVSKNLVAEGMRGSDLERSLLEAH